MRMVAYQSGEVLQDIETDSVEKGLYALTQGIVMNEVEQIGEGTKEQGEVEKDLDQKTREDLLGLYYDKIEIKL